ncbi:hypothetical protein SGLAM104S_10460 [Streptomyces glaucescens]
MACAAVPPPFNAGALRAAQRRGGERRGDPHAAGRARHAAALQESDTGVHEVLRSAWKPLAAPVRQDMESRFGTDFSDVRLHTGAAAARLGLLRATSAARAHLPGVQAVGGHRAGERRRVTGPAARHRRPVPARAASARPAVRERARPR